MIFVKHLCVTPRNVLQHTHASVQLAMVTVLNVSVECGIMVDCSCFCALKNCV